LKVSWPYVAGFFDGEGCITHAWRKHGEDRGYFVLSTSITQCGPIGKIVLTEIKEFLSEFGIVCQVRHDARKGTKLPHWKEKFDLRVNRRESIIIFLRGLMPYVRVKKVITQDTLRFLVRFPSINGRLKGLNIDKAKILADRQAGMSYNKMSVKYGVSVERLWDAVNRGPKKFPFRTISGGNNVKRIA
jgi:LAGLIDADG-like domain